MSRRPEPNALPSASIEVLRRRADLLTRTRRFFAARNVLEVDTPLLGAGLVVDAHIDPVECAVDGLGRRYLLPSPEAPMKRLLAAGSGPIFQIAKAFRQGERGRLHQPEFTMLEWYRPGFDEHDLMDEAGELLRELLDLPGWTKRTYGEVFEDLLDVDPHRASVDVLAGIARAEGVAPPGDADRDGWLELLFATCIEPRLDPSVATFVRDFPASQAALATVRDDDPPVARRFELLYGGMELCNGYHELRDADAHRERFDAANAARAAIGKTRIEPDEALLSAVEHGLPACAGVALGFDRVVMLACGASHIDDVLAFPAG